MQFFKYKLAKQELSEFSKESNYLVTAVDYKQKSLLEMTLKGFNIIHLRPRFYYVFLVLSPATYLIARE